MENTLSFSLLHLISNLYFYHVSSFHFHLPAISFSTGSCSLLAREVVCWEKGRCSLGHHSDAPDISWTPLHCGQRSFMKTDSKGHLSYSLLLFLFPFQHNPLWHFPYFLWSSHVFVPPPMFYNVLLWFKAFFPYLPQLLSLVPSHTS